MPSWTFNGDLRRPTFHPSVRISWGREPGSKCCHYNITDGTIFYHGDTTHKLSGQTLALEPIPVGE